MIRISTERPNSKGPAITPTTAKILQQAYDHFNRELFGRSLPDVVIVLHRKSHSFGYFGADRFTERGGDLHHHELALNPDGFIGRTDLQICSTLGHEMCHVWQKVCGTPSARAYHNKEWAAQMKTIGLQPSSTGQVGGKETGQHMTHYVIPGGRFEKSFTRLAATGWTLNLESTAHAGRQGGGPNTGKTKFSCEGDCGVNAWGKPSLDVLCASCLTKKLEAGGIPNISAIFDGTRMREAQTEKESL